MKIKGLLNNNSIDNLITESLLALEKAGCLKDDRLRFRLTLEEILLDYQGILPKSTLATVSIKKKSDTIKVKVSIEGEEYNPLKETDSLVLIKTIHKWESAPVYRYVNKGAGTNALT